MQRLTLAVLVALATGCGGTEYECDVYSGSDLMWSNIDFTADSAEEAEDLCEEKHEGANCRNCDPAD